MMDFDGVFKEGMKALKNKDLDEAYEYFSKAKKLKPNDPQTNILYALLIVPDDSIADEKEMATQKSIHIVNSIENGLLDLPETDFADWIEWAILDCIDTNDRLHRECTDKVKTLSHNKLVDNIRAIETTTSILDYIIAKLTIKKADIYQNKPIYLKALKELSLRLSIMYGKYECKECKDSCKSTQWNYVADIDERFNWVNEKILEIDPKYKIPTKWKKVDKKKNRKASVLSSILCLILAIAIGVIVSTIKGIDDNVLIIIVYADFIFGAISIIRLIIAFASRKNKKAYCKQCGKKITVDEIVGTALIGTTTTEDEVLGSVIVTYKCSDCGNISTVQLDKIVLKYIDGNGWMQSYTLESQVAEFFRNAR